MNNKVVSEQTKILIELISKHYQYYYQQSLKWQVQSNALTLVFYQDFISNFNLELEHVDFAFPIIANLGCDVEAEQVSRWVVYWQLEFNQQRDVTNGFACTVQLMTANQQKSDFKLVCENGTSQYIQNI